MGLFPADFMFSCISQGKGVWIDGGSGSLSSWKLTHRKCGGDNIDMFLTFASRRSMK
jgi:hypothetical protein